MKILLFLLLFPSAAFAQNYTLPVFTAQGFAKATTSTDTSATIYIPYTEHWVNVLTTTTGSDSSKIYVNVDAMMNGTWSLSIVRDTVTLGRPAGHTLATTKGQIESYFLRAPFSSDILQNSFQVRIRNVHASGSNDSTSVLTYTQNIITRQ